MLLKILDKNFNIRLNSNLNNSVFLTSLIFMKGSS